MSLLGRGRYKSARAIIVQDGRLLTFYRKRHSRKTGEWIEYYSIPGGEIDEGETPEVAVVRELYEEMGVTIAVDRFLAHRISTFHEHFVFSAHIVDGEPRLMLDSEEADLMNENNQFIVTWVEVAQLTKKNLRYYGDYVEIIRQLAEGRTPKDVLRIKSL